MEKNYVYKVRANSVIYDNLASAIEDCVQDLRNKFIDDRASKPIIVKVYGGYQVMMTDITGSIYKRGIDVFVPKHLVDKVDYYIDELQETMTCSCEDEDDDYEEDDDCEDDDEYEDEEDDDEDEPTYYCERCGEEYGLADLVNIDGFEYCKDCAKEYLEDNY